MKEGPGAWRPSGDEKSPQNLETLRAKKDSLRAELAQVESQIKALEAPIRSKEVERKFKVNNWTFPGRTNAYYPFYRDSRSRFQAKEDLDIDINQSGFIFPKKNDGYFVQKNVHLESRDFKKEEELGWIEDFLRKNDIAFSLDENGAMIIDDRFCTTLEDIYSAILEENTHMTKGMDTGVGPLRKAGSQRNTFFVKDDTGRYFQLGLMLQNNYVDRIRAGHGNMRWSLSFDLLPTKADSKVTIRSNRFLYPSPHALEMGEEK